LIDERLLLEPDAKIRWQYSKSMAFQLEETKRKPIKRRNRAKTFLCEADKRRHSLGKMHIWIRFSALGRKK
jgi:hypothetical protein